MKSTWSDKKVSEYIARYGEQGTPKDLAERVYTTRLLGRDPLLVLHGGGNTSVKTVVKDTLGEDQEVLCVKGSGWDMGEIEPRGLPAVRLEPLQKARKLDRMSDEDMVNFQRVNLIDASAPNPSVETLLHAFLPHKFVDHTHSTDVLALIDQPDGEALAREVYGKSMGIVPYIMPGFLLARKAAEIYRQDTTVEGLILLRHGIFTFAETARESYERMISKVSLAEERVSKGSRTLVPVTLPQNLASIGDVAPIIRGACAIVSGTDADKEPQRLVATFRSNEAVLDYVNGEHLDKYSQRGVVTPDHTIRTKNIPLLVPAPQADKLDEFAKQVEKAIAEYKNNYNTYFEKQNSRCTPPKTRLDPMPRVVMIPGLGLMGLGNSVQNAAVAADIAENTVRVITDAECLGQFEPLAEADLFDMEYWSLEQAKLGQSAEKPLARQIVVITGGGGTIGSAIGRAMAAEGASVALLDIDESMASKAARAFGGLGIQCDVTDRVSIRNALDAVCAHFGGVDILVSNAGAAWQGRIGEVADKTLRDSFELNFFAHQSMAQEAFRIMKAQGTGGCLLFNVSKQAVNPGPDFGPYGLAKAALMFLVKQYAVDHGRHSIRSNGLNADRIRSGLLTSDMIATRSRARGLSEADYLGGNLLNKEVTADDIARGFVNLARAHKTTGHIDVIDGGNIAASLR